MIYVIFNMCNSLSLKTFTQVIVVMMACLVCLVPKVIQVCLEHQDFLETMVLMVSAFLVLVLLIYAI